VYNPSIQAGRTLMALMLALSLLVGGGGKIEWTQGEKEKPLLETIDAAKKDGSLVMAYFTADW
jgi:hypothetical protein